MTLHEDDDGEQTDGDVTPTHGPQVISLSGRVDPFELVLRIFNDSGGTGLGRLLDVHGFDGEQRGS